MNILDSLKKYFYKNGSSEASSDARIPLLTATGEPKGSDTMANIASVLGVGINALQTGADLNDLRTPNMYVCFNGATSSTILNKPANVGYGFLVEVKPCPYAPSNVVQILWADGGRMFSRTYDNGWSNWLTYSYGIPDFYKSYQDLGSLSTALGGLIPIEGYTGDVNDLDKTSIAITYTKDYDSNHNWPDPSGGFFVTFVGENNSYFRLQLFMHYAAESMYVRVKWGDWSAWKRIQLS